MAWFRKEKKPREAVEQKQVAIPEGLWIKCDDCKEIIYRKEVEQNLSVCTKCGYHFRLTARERFNILFDDAAFERMPLPWRESSQERSAEWGGGSSGLSTQHFICRRRTAETARSRPSSRRAA